MKFRTTTWIFSALCITALFGCGEVTVINKKEKIIERNAPAVPGFYSDRFLVGRPYGKANVLWVVDNSQDIDSFLERKARGPSTFQQGYEKVVRTLIEKKGPLASLKSRVHLTLTPSTWSQKSSSAIDAPTLDAHLKQLFSLASPQGMLLSSRSSQEGDLRDRGYPDPFVTTLKGLSNEVFAAQSEARLYIVFVMASSGTVSRVNSVLEFENQISPLRPTRSVEVFNLVPGERSVCKGRAARPDRFLAEQSKIGWSLSGEGDLCSDTPEKWAQQILSWIETKQQVLRLSFRPEDPASLMVKTPRRSLHYGTEFTYDADKNEVIISPTLNPRLSTDEDRFLDIQYYKEIHPLGDK